MTACPCCSLTHALGRLEPQVCCWVVAWCTTRRILPASCLPSRRLQWGSLQEEHLISFRDPRRQWRRNALFVACLYGG